MWRSSILWSQVWPGRAVKKSSSEHLTNARLTGLPLSAIRQAVRPTLRPLTPSILLVAMALLLFTRCRV